MTAGGPLNRRRSLSRDARQSAAPYARRASSSASVDARSSALTAHANSTLSFDDVDVPPEAGSLGAARRAIGAALSFRPSKAVVPVPIELSIWKPNASDALGITFELPGDSSLEGVVVAAIQPGQLMAKAKKLKEGDVVHVINGRAVATPQEGAHILSAAKGVIQLVITRSARQHASLGPADDACAAEGGDGEELSRGDRARSSLLQIALPAALTGGRRSKKDEPAETAAATNTGAGATATTSAAGGSSSAAGGGGEEGSATVVVSCSQLVLESKRIVGSAAGLDSTLDELYAALKAKALPSQAALARLIEVRDARQAERSVLPRIGVG